MRIIRPYTPKDWDAICQIHDLARKKELELAGQEEAFLPLKIAAGREGLFDCTILVCQDDKAVTGFVAFRDEELAWLYVHPDHTRRGIGRELAEQALEQMSDGSKTVEVLLGNEPARRLYRSLGFSDGIMLSGHMPGNESYYVTVYQMTMG